MRSIDFGEYGQGARWVTLEQADEARELRLSCQSGIGQVFMHKEYGDIIIAWPVSFDSHYQPGQPTKHTIHYKIEGEHSPGSYYADMRGNPFLYNFEYLGEFGDMHED